MHLPRSNRRADRRISFGILEGRQIMSKRATDCKCFTAHSFVTFCAARIRGSLGLLTQAHFVRLAAVEVSLFRIIGVGLQPAPSARLQTAQQAAMF